MRLTVAWGLLLGATLAWNAGAAQPVLVLQSDFGLLDGAVASMKGVAVGVAPDIHIYTSTRLPWLTLPEDVPAVPEYYSAKEVWPEASLERYRRLKRGNG